MDKRTIIAGGALAIVAGVGLVYTRSPADLPLPKPGEVQSAPSLSARHADGGNAGCVAKFTVADGGREWRRLEACDCVRRPAQTEVANCQWLRPQFGGDGGSTQVKVPVGFRFAADASVGSGCQPVACAVMAGENPNE